MNQRMNILDKYVVCAHIGKEAHFTGKSTTNLIYALLKDSSLTSFLYVLLCLSIAVR